MNNFQIEKFHTKAIKIENAFHLLSLAFTVVVTFEIVSTSSYFLDNFADEESMVMQFLSDMKQYALQIL
jgi:hypothetical protein